ncbi:hypothetical protein BU15DRAFT_86489 [Melanogaster broomeanus]|nr:hypothetical protein BU15DRAFT_86489 [Melanogaster broomeanus]
MGMTLATYVLSLLSGNYGVSVPAIYTIYYALLPLWPRVPPTWFFPYTPETVHESVSGTYSPRALVMMVLVVTWMCRLSYHTWRRGLYNVKAEDYRWEVLRQKLPPWLFQVVNLTFIAITQNIILFLLGLPAQIAVTQPHIPLSTSDYVLGVLGFLTILVEFVADNQQYSYQRFKHSGKLDTTEWPGARIAWTKRDVERGFVTRGLWAWSRHPNFVCEQLFWIIINFIPLVSPHAPAVLFSPTPFTALAPLLPSLVLCTLFSSSTKFTESISLPKYPVYKAYQRRVGMFLPFLTPVWGLLLSLQGKKAEVDELVYGQGVGKGKKVE